MLFEIDSSENIRVVLSNEFSLMCTFNGASRIEYSYFEWKLSNAYQIGTYHNQAILLHFFFIFYFLFSFFLPLNDGDTFVPQRS